MDLPPFRSPKLTRVNNSKSIGWHLARISRVTTAGLAPLPNGRRIARTSCSSQGGTFLLRRTQVSRIIRDSRASKVTFKALYIRLQVPKISTTIPNPFINIDQRN
jgi:hypothetical protein